MSFANDLRFVLLCSAVALVSAWNGSSPKGPLTGRLVLRNATWDSARAEVRVGGSGGCEELRVFRTRTLLRGRAWSIDATGLVCWRRDLEPERPDGQWTPWRQHRLDGNASVEAML